MGPKIPTYSRYRPRILTLVVLLLVAAPTVLANLTLERSFDAQPHQPGVALLKEAYGWPLIWRWNTFTVNLVTSNPAGSGYSAARLATNLAIWLVMVATPAATCEWLLRRYRPRLRWSLRTMLVAVAAIAALSAWFAAARKRANLQDTLIARMAARSENVWVKRSGPRWLGFFGVDRFRRHIVRANVRVGYDGEMHHDDLEVLNSLLLLPGLQSLDLDVLHLSPAIEERLRDMGSPNLQCLRLQVDRLTPAITVGLGKLPRLRMLGLSVYDASPQAIEALADLQQLRAVSIHDQGASRSKRMERQFLDAVGKLTRLEHLHLSYLTVSGDGLQRLSGLADLKLLGLESISSDGPPLLAHLPSLPRLEGLDLHLSDVGDDDVRQIAAQPGLKALNLAFTDVTSAGLAQLASCESLEELVVNDDAISIAAIESLIALEHLRALHIYAFGRPAKWELDEGNKDAKHWRNAFGALRRSKPDIVIDSGTELNTMRNVWEAWEAPGGGWGIRGEVELAR